MIPVALEAQLAQLTAQGVALAGSHERFNSLLSAKPVVTRTVESEIVATQVVIADIKAAWTPLQKAEATIADLRALTMALGASEAGLLAQVAQLTQENVSLKGEHATVEARVETRASMKALAITGGQGVPALNVERGEGGIHEKPKSRDELHVAYAQIADPVARAAFYAKHEIAMFKKD